MLQRLVILNSKVYGRAEVRLDDTDSLQLVGPNNIGKSTLIYALNFLFVVDGNKMSFSGQRRGDKETVHHYFPTPNQSYIIFEVYKHSYYCILVKRDTEGELEYYRFDHEYQEDFFFKNEKGQQRLLKFEEVRENFMKSGVNFTQFKNKSEVFNAVYQRGKSSDAVVWLEDSVKTDGLSNNFSKVYRYLINTKLITNKNLKEALIIADNREHEGLSFSQKNKKDINDLLRINEEIKAVRSVQNEFEDFREDVNKYSAKTKIVGELIYAFKTQYTSSISHLEALRIEKEKNIQDTTFNINEELKPREQTLNRSIGNREAEIKLKEESLIQKQKLLEEINAFEGKQFLINALHNLDNKRKLKESTITRIENQKLSSDQVEGKITNLKNKSERLNNQIENYNNQLIHKITAKQEDKKLLNYIFSSEFSSLSASLIKKKITKTGSPVSIFDGSIQLPKDLKLNDLPSVESLKDELKEVKKEITEQEELLKAIKDFEHQLVELTRIKNDIEAINEKLKRLESKPELEKIIDSITEDLKNLKKDKEQSERNLKSLVQEITRQTTSLEVLKDEKVKLEKRIDELHQKKEELEQIDVDALEFETSESLDELYNKIRIHNKDREEIKQRKDKVFDTLKYKIKTAHANEDEFIRYLEEEIACLNDKERSIDGLLQSISTQFANPAFHLVKRYQEFREFIYNKFNIKLASTRISDIESLRIELLDNKKIIEDLKRISSIHELSSQTTLDFDQSENLKVLNQYLDNGKKINFDELFDIELHLNIKGSEKKVDLKDQVESDGTDRMIRLVIVMSIINRLALNDVNNKIALFVDEVGTIDEHNRPELVRFCKDHNFIPIFAAPQPFDGFGKYYFLFRSHGKINVNENQHAIKRENLTIAVN